MLPLPKPEVWWVLPALDCMEVSNSAFFCSLCVAMPFAAYGSGSSWTALSDRFFGSN